MLDGFINYLHRVYPYLIYKETNLLGICCAANRHREENRDRKSPIIQNSSKIINKKIINIPDVVFTGVNKRFAFLAEDQHIIVCSTLSYIYSDVAKVVVLS